MLSQRSHDYNHKLQVVQRLNIKACRLIYFQSWFSRLPVVVCKWICVRLWTCCSGGRGAASGTSCWGGCPGFRLVVNPSCPLVHPGALRLLVESRRPPAPFKSPKQKTVNHWSFSSVAAERRVLLISSWFHHHWFSDSVSCHVGRTEPLAEPLQSGWLHLSIWCWIKRRCFSLWPQVCWGVFSGLL